MRGIVVRLAIIAIIGLGAWVARDRLSGSAGSLRVGDCFDVQAEQTRIEDVQHLPCTEAHHGEVVYVGDHPAPDGAPPLTEDDLEAFVMDTCGGAMISYVGGLEDVETNAELQSIDLGWIYPTDEGWSGGERRITCYLHSVDGSKLTRSLKAAS